MTRPVPAALAALMLCAGAALAQNSSPEGGPTLPPQGQQIPERIRPDADASGGATLSDKLEKSDGVIKPPGGVDPAIKTVPPASDSEMPVIKPPGNAR